MSRRITRAAAVALAAGAVVAIAAPVSAAPSSRSPSGVAPADFPVTLMVDKAAWIDADGYANLSGTVVSDGVDPGYFVNVSIEQPQHRTGPHGSYSIPSCTGVPEPWYVTITPGTRWWPGRLDVHVFVSAWDVPTWIAETTARVHLRPARDR